MWPLSAVVCRRVAHTVSLSASAIEPGVSIGSTGTAGTAGAAGAAGVEEEDGDDVRQSSSTTIVECSGDSNEHGVLGMTSLVAYRVLQAPQLVVDTQPRRCIDSHLCPHNLSVPHVGPVNPASQWHVPSPVQSPWFEHSPRSGRSVSHTPPLKLLTPAAERSTQLGMKREKGDREASQRHEQMNHPHPVREYH